MNDHFLHTPPILKTLFVSFHRWRIHLIKHSKKAKGTCDQRAHSVSNIQSATQPKKDPNIFLRLLTLFPRRNAPSRRRRHNFNVCITPPPPTPRDTQRCSPFAPHQHLLHGKKKRTGMDTRITNKK